MAASYIEPLLVPGQPRWNSGSPLGTPVNVTYSFMTRVPSYYPSNAKERNNFVAFNSDQIDGAKRALDLYKEVANITFTQVPEIYLRFPFFKIDFGGDIRFGTANFGDNGPSHAFFPGTGTGGDIWFNHKNSSYLTQTNGSSGFLGMIHEIGHALGLADTIGRLPAFEDNRQYTVMSYNSHPGSSVEAQTLMLYDIAAIQYLYGENYNTRAGDDTYSWDIGKLATEYKPFVMTIWDGGGIDTISAENQFLPVTIDLRAGSFSSIGLRTTGDYTPAENNLAIAYGVTIEGAIGGLGKDTIRGNEVNNSISGGFGNDTLNGMEGNDTLDGGRGNDTLTGESGDDVFRFTTGSPFSPDLMGMDVITDFTRDLGNTDKIYLSKETFSAIMSADGIGFSNMSEFAEVTSDSAAETSTAFIVYNSDTGNLFYNQNGSDVGFGTGAQFANLENKFALGVTDFVIGV